MEWLYPALSTMHVQRRLRLDPSPASDRTPTPTPTPHPNPNPHPLAIPRIITYEAFLTSAAMEQHKEQPHVKVRVRVRVPAVAALVHAVAALVHALAPLVRAVAALLHAVAGVGSLPVRRAPADRQKGAPPP